jgi:predicted helicase
MSPNLHYLAKHINGEMSAGARNRILREFKMSARGVITNARCLGEGVNVPVRNVSMSLGHLPLAFSVGPRLSES